MRTGLQRRGGCYAAVNGIVDSKLRTELVTRPTRLRLPAIPARGRKQGQFELRRLTSARIVRGVSQHAAVKRRQVCTHPSQQKCDPGVHDRPDRGRDDQDPSHYKRIELFAYCQMTPPRERGEIDPLISMRRQSASDNRTPAGIPDGVSEPSAAASISARWRRAGYRGMREIKSQHSACNQLFGGRGRDAPRC